METAEFLGLLDKAKAIRLRDPRAGRYTIADQLGVTDHMARRLIRQLKEDPTCQLADAELNADVKATRQEGKDRTEHTEWSQNADGVVQATTVIEQVRSLDELLDFFSVDTVLWEVDKHVVNQWGKGDLMQVKAWLSKRKNDEVVDPLRQLFEAFADRQPVVKPPRTLEYPNNPVVMVPSPVDHHFGALVWGTEAKGDDWDLKHAVAFFQGAIEHAFSEAEHMNITKVILPLGHDLFNFDTARGQTMWGTQLDNDSRPGKVFMTVCLAMVNAIEFAANRVPNVEVILVPGNHDTSWSHHLMMFIWAWFKNDERVLVDISPNKRKAKLEYDNFLCFVHGDQKKWQDLPLQCATLWPDMWGRARHWEVLHGHVHHERVKRYVPLDSGSGVFMRALPSLVATDYWHYDKGYLGARRAMKTLIYKRSGLRAEVLTDVEDITGATPVLGDGNIDFGIDLLERYGSLRESG